MTILPGIKTRNLPRRERVVERKEVSRKENGGNRTKKVIWSPILESVVRIPWGSERKEVPLSNSLKRALKTIKSGKGPHVRNILGDTNAVKSREQEFSRRCRTGGARKPGESYGGRESKWLCIITRVTASIQTETQTCCRAG